MPRQPGRHSRGGGCPARRHRARRTDLRGLPSRPAARPGSPSEVRRGPALVAVDAWLDALRARLPGHAALLDALIAICRSDVRIRLLELQCSIARGAGDELSDLDV